MTVDENRTVRLNRVHRFQKDLVVGLVTHPTARRADATTTTTTDDDAYSIYLIVAPNWVQCYHDNKNNIRIMFNNNAAIGKTTPHRLISLSDVTIRGIQSADSPEVARIWRAGLKQTHQSIRNPIMKCLLYVLLKYMEREAEGLHGDFGPEGSNLIQSWGGNGGNNAYKEPSCKIMLVAANNSNGQILGCCGVKRGTDEGKDVEDTSITVFSIWRMSVSEDVQHMGLGTLLMRKSEEWAISQGGTTMHLITGNPAASKFYQRIGYTKLSSFEYEKSLLM